MKIDKLDKNEMLLAHIIPRRAIPDIVSLDPNSNPTDLIKTSETIMNALFLFQFSVRFL